MMKQRPAIFVLTAEMGSTIHFRKRTTRSETITILQVGRFLYDSRMIKTKCLNSIIQLHIILFVLGEFIGSSHNSCNMNKTRLKPFLNIFIHNFTGILKKPLTRVFHFLNIWNIILICFKTFITL